ncbi:hypothetical protein DEO72_LG8g2953 [Vigna unguiculata]|uniref:Uncharacterized protein n=1 Tax=Vigna unguiculata TaxID=3917 RepID=A0A4D6MWB3_VIGUN|nr:hypothetical protein DEO72_LG8g2953 [Vigna unguiculata]
MSSSSDIMSLSSSSSGSVESSRGVGRRVEEESNSSVAVVGRISMETVTEVREDPLEEITESNCPTKAGYDWVAADVRNQSSLFQWSRQLNSWLNYTSVIAKGVDCSIVSLEQVSAVECVCHSQEGAAEKFFHMYMCHFSQLHVRLPLDDFTMGVLRQLNVAPTQLHPNSLAYLRPSISRLDAFSESFKNFKDGYFKVMVKEEGKSHYLNVDGSTKFPFSWTGSPSRYKDMGTDKLSAADKEVVEVLMKFFDKLPTKGLVRVYNLVHPIIDIEGHMAQAGKKNLTLFQALRKERAVKAKTAGNTEGKDVKKVRAALLRQGSSSGAKGPEAGLIELPETSVRKDIDINLSEIVINSIDSMEPDHLVRRWWSLGARR